MARPCPTSSTVNRNSPGESFSGIDRNSGNIITAPTQRAGKPLGSSIQSAPATAIGTAHPGGACCCHTASGRSLSARSKNMQNAMTRCAAWAIQSSGSTDAASASGTTIRLTSGIAKALATGDTSDTCWNMASRNGTSASVTAHWVCAQTRNQPFLPIRDPPANMMTATAPKESQKPGAITAIGSSTTTSAAAAARTVVDLAVQPDQSAAATTASM